MLNLISLILLRKEIRCPEIIRCHPRRDPGGRQSEVAGVKLRSALGQDLLLGYLSYLILLFFWSF